MKEKVIDFLRKKGEVISHPFLEFIWYQQNNVRLIFDIDTNTLMMCEYIDEFPGKNVTYLDTDENLELAIKTFGI